jgi:hypothetical protein
MLVGLVVVALSATSLGAELFPTEARRLGFLQALTEQDALYDPGEQMLRSPFSSPGYHTTLSDGYVHRTRNSLEHAVALLDSGDPNNAARAAAIIARVIGLQDQDPESRTYGIWSWFLEEPLEQMSPPDWNWADFCGTQLLQVAIDHGSRLPLELRQKVRESILHAAQSIKRRNVGPGYTNIALMGTYVTLVAGERLVVRELFDYGRARLRRFYDYTEERGSFSEYNSPTYTLVAIEEISRMRQHVRDAQSRALLEALNEFAWGHLARRFHAPTQQWAGPHSRSYSTLLRRSALGFIQRATSDEVAFMPEAEAWESIDAQRVKLECPSDLYEKFLELERRRQEVEVFVHNPGDQHGIVGTTYLHPQLTLGSVNIGDLWNQRRPLVAYWNAPGGAVAMRVRCLHDDYDYSSASIFTVQDESDALSAVVFATDRGDTHISLDRIRNGTIRARDLRVRLQFEGAVGDLVLPRAVAMEEPVQFTSGQVAGTFCVHQALFDGRSVTVKTGRDAETAWIDVVLYQGPSVPFDFEEIREAAVVFTLSLVTPAILLPSGRPSVAMGIGYSDPTTTARTTTRQRWTWQRTNDTTLSLAIPITPLPSKAQIKVTSAKIGPANPWKTGSP